MNNLIFKISLLFLIFLSCNNSDKNEKDEIFSVKLPKIEEISFSAGTDYCTINNSLLKWNLLRNKNIHEFTKISFSDSTYISYLKITSEIPIKKILIACDNKIIDKYNINKPIKLSKKLKNLTLLIFSVSGSKILENKGEKDTIYYIEYPLNTEKNNFVNIEFYKSRNTKAVLNSNAKSYISESFEKYNNDTSFGKRFINHYHTKQNEKIIQSVLLSRTGKFSFYRNKLSIENPQEYIAEGEIKNFDNVKNKLQIKIKLYNLLNGDTINYTDVFKLSESRISGAKLFKQIYTDLQDKILIDLTLLSPEFVYDIRYATKNNFLDTVLYKCPKCLLRYEVAKDLIKLNNALLKQKLRLVVYDCYRPLSVQKLMWEKLPYEGFVANPQFGSRHNRGTAVDVSIVDFKGNLLDMGTDHDFFGPKARSFYQNLPDTVIKNRMFLRKMMEKYNFTGINSEWWHFNHIAGRKYKVSDVEFDCE